MPKIFNNIGNVYFGCGRNAVALDYYQRSLSIKERIGNPQDIAYTLDNIGTVYAMQQQWDKAEDAYSRARRLFENFSQQIGDPTQLADLQETMNHFYERYADVLAQQNRAGEGLALLEAGRAQGLARQIALNGSDYTAYFTADEKQELKQRTRRIYDSQQSAPCDGRAINGCFRRSARLFSQAKERVSEAAAGRGTEIYGLPRYSVCPLSAVSRSLRRTPPDRRRTQESGKEKPRHAFV